MGTSVTGHLREAAVRCKWLRSSANRGASTMAYLTNIGPDGSNRSNKFGVGSRGCWVFRRGKTVITRYGPVEAVREKGVRLYWLWWRENKKIKCDSVIEALSQVQQVIAKQKLPRLGYALLPAQSAISVWKLMARFGGQGWPGWVCAT